MTTNQKVTAEEMVKKLKDLQNKLTTFENNYDSKYNHLEKRSRINQELDEKNEKLVELQKSMITIDIGGEKLLTSAQLINNCKFDNVLQDLIGDSNNFFLDIPAEYFKRVLFIMRNKPKGCRAKRLRVEFTEKMNAEVLLSVCRKIFKGDEIFKEIHITPKILDKTDVMDFLYRKNYEEEYNASQPEIEQNNYTTTYNDDKDDDD